MLAPCCIRTHVSHRNRPRPGFIVDLGDAALGSGGEHALSVGCLVIIVAVLGAAVGFGGRLGDLGGSEADGREVVHASGFVGGADVVAAFVGTVEVVDAAVVVAVFGYLGAGFVGFAFGAWDVVFEVHEGHPYLGFLPGGVGTAGY